MRVPQPTSLRVETRAGSGKLPRPPFGLSQWTADAAAVAIVLDASACDLQSEAEVAAMLPPPSSVGPGTYVFVMGAASRGAGLLRRWLGTVAVSRAVRCTALLARGYVGVGAGVDPVSGVDLAWGTTSG